MQLDRVSPSKAAGVGNMVTFGYALNQKNGGPVLNFLMKLREEIFRMNLFRLSKKG